MVMSCNWKTTTFGNTRSHALKAKQDNGKLIYKLLEC